MVNPCCECCPLRIGTKVIAIVQIIFNLIGLGLMAAIIIITGQAEKDSKKETHVGWLPFVLIIIILFSLGFSMVLLVGAFKRLISFLMGWVVYTIISTIIFTAVIVVETILSKSYILFALPVIVIGIHGYFIWVIIAFVKELRERKLEASASRDKERSLKSESETENKKKSIPKDDHDTDLKRTKSKPNKEGSGHSLGKEGHQGKRNSNPNAANKERRASNPGSIKSKASNPSTKSKNSNQRRRSSKSSRKSDPSMKSKTGNKVGDSSRKKS